MINVKAFSLAVNVLLFIMFLIVSISCRNDQNTITNINITKGLKRDWAINLSEITNEIKTIPLETNKECIIGSIRQIMIKDSCIYICDRYDNFFIFNSGGRLLRKIQNKGNGPEEYLSISNFDVSTKGKLLYFFDGVKSKIFIFDFDGKYKMSKNLEKTYATRICLYNDSTLALFFERRSLPNSGYFRILLLDKNFQVIKQLQKIEQEEINYLRLSSFWSKMYVKENKMYYWESDCDTVYSVSNYTVSPHFVFKTDRYNLPQNIKNSSTKSISWRGKYVEISNFFETPKYLFVTARFDVYKKCILYNKSNSSSLNVVFNYKIYDNGFHNDIDGGIPFWPKGQTEEGELFDYMTPYELKKFMSNDYFKNIKIKDQNGKIKLEDLLVKSSIEDNPIIFIINPNK